MVPLALITAWAHAFTARSAYPFMPVRSVGWQRPGPTASATAVGHCVAQWCCESGRAEASVAISGASTLTGAMRDFWQLAHRFGGEGGAPGRQMVVAFPEWRQADDARTFQEVLQHIDECAEICEFLGETLLVAGRHPGTPQPADEPERATVPTIVLRSFMQEPWGDYGDENFGEADPFADLPDTAMDEAVSLERPSDEACVEQTLAWVGSITAQIGLAPPSPDGSTVDAALARVACPLTHARTGELVYAAFWGAVSDLANSAESVHETTLLIATEFARYNAHAFEFFASTLNEALPPPMNLGEDVQLVFYHPQPSITEMPDEAAKRRVDFALNSVPFPTINLLRTAQVDLARQRIEAGSPQTRALIELHERVCGPEGGLLL